MNVKELDIKKCLTTIEFNPSPNRLSENETPVSQRRIPIIYTCDKCGKAIHFRTEDFQKHFKTDYTNLNPKDKKYIDDFLTRQDFELKANSFLDFYCKNCKQATTIFFDGNESGYWGIFEFEIKSVLAIRH